MENLLIWSRKRITNKHLLYHNVIDFCLSLFLLNGKRRKESKEKSRTIIKFLPVARIPEVCKQTAGGGQPRSS